MTTSDLALAVARRWWVALIGLGLTAWCLTALSHESPVYTSTTDVQVVMSTRTLHGPPGPQSFVAVAGLLAADAEARTTFVRPASPDVSLTSMGVTHGVRVFQPDRGGQWQDTFVDPYVRVSAADTTPEGASARLDAAVQRLEDRLETLQDQAGIATNERIGLVPVPRRPGIVAAGQRPSEALAVAALLGVFLTVGACAETDRWVRRRQRRRAAAPGPVPVS